MSFLDRPSRQGKNYQQLGYARNPFPKGAEVRPEVFVERPELAKLSKELASFVFEEGGGGFWAIEATRGVGKSNLLRHIEAILREHEESSDPPGICYRYIGSQLVAPRRLSNELLLAIGEKRIRRWLNHSARPSVPDHLRGTDLDKFLGAVHSGLANSGDSRKAYAAQAAEMLIRWLSGQQTYSNERVLFGISTRERLEPASSFPYTRYLVDQLVAGNHLKGIVLLIDEFEDVLAASPTATSSYAMALKALVNTFNMDRLFLILAGQEGTFARIGVTHTSLSARWTVQKLDPLKSEDAALQMAEEYKNAASLTDKSPKLLVPRDDTIRKRYRELSRTEAPVIQRAFLDALHDWIDEHISNTD